MLRNTIRTLCAAALVAGAMTSGATAQLPGTGGTGSPPPPVGGPLGGGHRVTPQQAREDIKKIVADGKANGLTNREIKALVDQYIATH